MATQLGYALPLAHQFDLSQAELFAFGQLPGRIIGQVRLAECALDCLVYHCAPLISYFDAERMRPDAGRASAVPDVRTFANEG